MEDAYMIGKMNTFMHRLSERMSEWLVFEGIGFSSAASRV